MSQPASLMPGQSVTSHDHRKVGKLIGEREGWLVIRSRLHRAFLLREFLVDEVDGDRVTLQVSRRTLRRYRTPATPAIMGARHQRRGLETLVAVMAAGTLVSLLLGFL